MIFAMSAVIGSRMTGLHIGLGLIEIHERYLVRTVGGFLEYQDSSAFRGENIQPRQALPGVAAVLTYNSSLGRRILPYIMH